MNIGTLEIQLMADMAQLKKDMDDAKSTVSGAMGGIESAVNVAKAAFVALGGAAAVTAFAGMINGAIESAAALEDMSIATGASVESLSKFTEVGRMTNTSTEAIAGMMNKLAKSTQDAGDGTKGAGIALNALGINFETFRQMSPEEKLNTVATAMNGFRDGSEKSAVAMELLGKQGAMSLPFLKDVATAGDIGARVTKEQVAASNSFSDSLVILKTSGEAWKTELAMGMVPALDNAATAMVGVFNETGGLREEIRKLSADGTIATWTTNAISGVTRVMDIFSVFGRTIISVGEVIGAWAAMVTEGFSATFTAIGQAVSGNFGAAMDTMKGMLTNQKNTVGDLSAKLSDTWSEETLGQKLRARMGDVKAMGDASEAMKPQLDVSKELEKAEAARKAEAAATKAQEAAAKAHTAELKKQEEQYAKLMGGIDAKAAAMEAEMEQGKALTEAQKAELKLLADLESGTIKLTDKQRDNTLAAIANQAAVEAKYAAYKEDKKQTEENTKENANYLGSLQKSTDALISDTEKMRDNLSEMGLSREELAALSVAKDLDRAATLERKAEVIESTMGETEQSAAFRAQATALRDLAGLKEEGIHVKAAVEARNAWEATTRSIGTGLSNALTDAVLNGKDIWLTFRDFMVRTIIDGVIKNALASVISDGLNSLISGITGLKIGSGGGGSLIGSAINTGVNALTGGTGGVSGLLDKGVTALTGSSTSELISAAGSALGITGGGAAAGVGAFGGSAATATAVTGGGSIVGTSLAPLGAEAVGGTLAAASTGGAAAGVGSLAGAFVPLAIFLGAASFLGSLTGSKNGDGNLPADLTGNIQSYGADGQSSGAGGAYRSVTDSMNSQYIAAARSLGIAPAQSDFGYYSFDNGEQVVYSLSSSVNAAQYREPWQIMGNFQDSQTRAIVSALRGSTDDAGKLESIKAMFPGFRNGGIFGGGLRIVGEDGPELEATGPSRIFDATTTASMLRSGGASDSELLAEMRFMRRAFEALASDTKRTADAVNGKPEQPMPVEIDT